jgi:hypothetical protein
MACDSNNRPIELHESIELETPIHQWDFTDGLISSKETCENLSESCASVDKSKDGEVESESESNDDKIPVTSITLPSSDMVEISQSFYWPLYSRPIDWICQEHVTSISNATAMEACARRVIDELQSLSFSRSQEDDVLNRSDTSELRNVTRSNDAAAQSKELFEEKEDWFSQLSGGQKGKVELVRKLFLRDQCPSVLLGEECYLIDHTLEVVFAMHLSPIFYRFPVDETMAPLDPASKAQIMSKLKAFCDRSVVLVIYHTDVGRGPSLSDPSSEEDACVHSNSFFDFNLHVLEKHLVTRPLC